MVILRVTSSGVILTRRRVAGRLLQNGIGVMVVVAACCGVTVCQRCACTVVIMVAVRQYGVGHTRNQAGR